MIEKIIIFILAIVGFYFATRPPEVVRHETKLIDTLLVTDTVTIEIEGQATSTIEYDTIAITDTIFQVDTVYTVSFDSITPRFGVRGKTFWRRHDRSTYKLDMWLYPDTVEAKLNYLIPDTVRAYMSVNGGVYLDSSIVFIPVTKEIEWYKTNEFWFGLGVFSTAGLVWLIK